MTANNKKQVQSTELMPARAKRRERTHEGDAGTSDGNQSSMVKIDDLLQKGHAQTEHTRRTELRKRVSGETRTYSSNFEVNTNQEPGSATLVKRPYKVSQSQQQRGVNS